jgi:hypothetical protein
VRYVRRFVPYLASRLSSGLRRHEQRHAGTEHDAREENAGGRDHDVNRRAASLEAESGKHVVRAVSSQRTDSVSDRILDHD